MKIIRQNKSEKDKDKRVVLGATIASIGADHLHTKGEEAIEKTLEELKRGGYSGKYVNRLEKLSKAAEKTSTPVNVASWVVPISGISYLAYKHHKNKKHNENNTTK